ncbi:biofilm peroxide resistance protein BsmA [Brenneria uluponensis]|uniref:biofilm peroxide resistance protein BsmA n=1 Tax=Brenneria uluponensis TaxID=3057057 RepID=UPI0028E90214|nr:biofilm peroxide resistance protein BsmA [Brenneria ulupoensis]
MMKVHTLAMPILLIMLLAGCSVFEGKPVPPPPPGKHAIEVSRAQTYSLKKFGTVSVTVRGGPDDADREIQRQADARGADYYLIVMKTDGDGIMSELWHAYAVLYHSASSSSVKPSSTSSF